MRPPDDPVTATELSELAAEFPGYEFARQQKWGGGVAIVARRLGGCARPGLYVVVSDDLDELRRPAGGGRACAPRRRSRRGSRRS